MTVKTKRKFKFSDDKRDKIKHFLNLFRKSPFDFLRMKIKQFKSFCFEIDKKTSQGIFKMSAKSFRILTLTSVCIILMGIFSLFIFNSGKEPNYLVNNKSNNLFVDKSDSESELGNSLKKENANKSDVDIINESVEETEKDDLKSDYKESVNEQLAKSDEDLSENDKQIIEVSLGEESENIENEVLAMGGNNLLDESAIEESFAKPRKKKTSLVEDGTFLSVASLDDYKMLLVDETTSEVLITNEFQGAGTAQNWKDDDSYWNYSLPFTFNFYGVDYTDISVSSNGYICLDSTKDCSDYEPLLDETDKGPMILPLGVDLRTNVNASNDIYITENSNNVVIRWDAVEFGLTDQINFEIVLYSNGNIKLNYGDFAGTPDLNYSAAVGISKGDGVNYTASAYNGTTTFNQAQTSFWGILNPEVTSFSPADNSFSATLDTNLQITFDKAVYQGTGNIVVKKASDDSVVETIDVSSASVTGWGTDTLTIDLAQDLDYYTEYYVNIDATAIKDTDDIYYDGISDNTTWNFTTQGLNEVVREISDCECYEINSAETSQPVNTTLTFSDDEGVTYAYTPVDDGEGKDCNITHIKLTYNGDSNYIGEDLEAEFLGTTSGTEVVSEGNGKIILSSDQIGTYVFGAGSNDNGYDNVVDSAGNVYVTGDFLSTVDFDGTSGTDEHTSNGDDDVFITKYNADGTYGWTRTFGSSYDGAGFIFEEGAGVAVDSNDDVYVAGNFLTTVDFDGTSGTDEHTSNGSQDAFITKYNSDGSYGWTITFGNANTEDVNAITLDSSDNIYITGRFLGSTNFDGTGGSDIHSSVNSTYDVFITKYNSDGSYGWTRTFGGISVDNGFGVAIDSVDDVYITGYFQNVADFDGTAGTDSHSSNGSRDIFITKYHDDGSYGWTRTFGSFNDLEYGFGIAIYQGDDSVYVTGEFEGTVDFDGTASTDEHTSNGNADAFLTKYNSDGDYMWTKTFGAGFDDTGREVSVDSTGKIYTVGGFRSTVDFDLTAGTDEHTSNGLEDIFITNYDSDGSYGWTRTFGSTLLDSSYGIAVDSTNGYIYTTGFYQSTTDFDTDGNVEEYTSNGGYDVFLTKHSTDGDYGFFVNGYYASGSYQVQTSSATLLQQWSQFDAGEELATDTELTYEILDATCTTTLIPQTSSSTFDLSGVASSNTSLCVEVNFSTTNEQFTPKLDSWQIEYLTGTTNTDNSLTYSTQDDPVCSVSSVCGNGTVEGDETCDDGNTTDGDGCSSTCTIEPEESVCGNGIVEDGETCDDSNLIDGDGCSSLCVVEEQSCGNGTVEENETCDDGNTTDGDGCSSTCTIEEEPEEDDEDQYNKPGKINAQFFWGLDGNGNPRYITIKGGMKVLDEQSLHSDAYILVTWKDRAKGEFAYVIERSTNGGEFEKLDNLDKNTESYTDRDIEPGNSYTYRVYTKYNGEKGEKSSKVTVNIGNFPTNIPNQEVEEEIQIEIKTEEEPEETKEVEQPKIEQTIKEITPEPEEPTDYLEIAKNTVITAGAAAGLYAFILSSLLAFPINPLTTNTGSAIVRFLALPFGRKRKEYYQGIAFDAVTKQPVPNLPVQIVDVKSGLVQNTIVTNEEGKYGFLPEKGEYQIEINNPNYKLNIQQIRDELYGELYQGQTISVENITENTVISPNLSLIPPKNFNWKEFAKNQINKNTSQFRKTINVLSQILFIAGFIWSVISTILSPSTLLNWIILAFYIFLAFYQLINRKEQKRFGKVYKLSDEKPIPFSRLNLKKESKLKKFTVSDILGRYLLLSPEGNYKLEAKGTSLEGQPYQKEKPVKSVNGVVSDGVGV